MTDFTTVTHPVARKPHRCEECPGTIAKGEQYERVSGKWEGFIFRYAMCGRCSEMWAAALEAFDWWDAEERPALGDLRATLRVDCDILDPEAWLDSILAERAARLTATQAMDAATSVYQGVRS